MSENIDILRVLTDTPIDELLGYPSQEKALTDALYNSRILCSCLIAAYRISIKKTAFSEQDFFTVQEVSKFIRKTTNYTRIYIEQLCSLGLCLKLGRNGQFKRKHTAYYFDNTNKEILEKSLRIALVSSGQSP